MTFYFGSCTFVGMNARPAGTRMIDGKLYTVTNLDTSRGRSVGTRRRHSSGGKRRGATTARMFG